MVDNFSHSIPIQGPRANVRTWPSKTASCKALCQHLCARRDVARLGNATWLRLPCPPQRRLAGARVPSSTRPRATRHQPLLARQCIVLALSRVWSTTANAIEALHDRASQQPCVVPLPRPIHVQWLECPACPEPSRRTRQHVCMPCPPLTLAAALRLAQFRDRP
jgi:hypothetical protein